MAILKFGITKRKEDWDIIANIIASRGFPQTSTNKGFSWFLQTEIVKSFKPKVDECSEIASPTAKKVFELPLEDSVVNQIKCEARQLGIDPGTHISRKILDKLL